MIPDKRMGDVLFLDKRLPSWDPRDYQEPGIESFDPLGAVGDASAPGEAIGSLRELEMLLQGLILLAEVN